ncbi:MAG: FAD-dependent oxidoreductase [Gemmatimonadota bacterium]|nr:FAD-dependent oxidoreductase [Gemmatimonadota bacterium]
MRPTVTTAGTDHVPDCPVLIVGAGPTGLVLALWLARLGIRVRIIDKTGEPGTTSRAVGVAARTLELYRQLDLAEALVEGGVKVPAVNLWTRGKRAARLSLLKLGTGFTPFPFFLVFPQDAHERLLIERLGSLGIQVERRTELISFEQHAEGARATLRTADGAENLCEVKYLAGCDGAHSTVRESLGVGFPGGTYSELFYVADVDAHGPAVNDEIHLELDDADFLAVFPLKKKGHLRLIGSVRRPAAEQKKELTFEDVGRRVIEHMQLTVGRVNWFSTYHVHHRVAARFRGGRAFLLGDAAHIHSPAGGQGMNTGIGDAVNLAWKLAAVLGGHAPDGMLDSYEAERIGFARKLVATTDRVFTVVTKPGRAAGFVRTRVAPVIAPLLFRVTAVRRFMFRTVSQTAITYRGSALSEGSLGRIQGGDRLPWVELSPNRDNFEPLASIAWQVHVYGEPKPGVEECCAALAMPLHTFAWTPMMDRAGLSRGAIYLVRPDGYIALADDGARPERLVEYFAHRGMTVSAPSGLPESPSHSQRQHR